MIPVENHSKANIRPCTFSVSASRMLSHYLSKKSEFVTSSSILKAKENMRERKGIKISNSGKEVKISRNHRVCIAFTLFGCSQVLPAWIDEKDITGVPFQLD